MGPISLLGQKAQHRSNRQGHSKEKSRTARRFSRIRTGAGRRDRSVPRLRTRRPLNQLYPMPDQTAYQQSTTSNQKAADNDVARTPTLGVLAFRRNQNAKGPAGRMSPRTSCIIGKPPAPNAEGLRQTNAGVGRRGSLQGDHLSLVL